MKTLLIQSFITDFPHLNNSEVAKCLSVSRSSVIKAKSISVDYLSIDWTKYEEMDVSMLAKGLYFHILNEIGDGWYTTKTTQCIADELSLTFPTVQKAIRELQVAGLIFRRPQITDGKQRMSTRGNGSYHYYLSPNLSSEQNYTLRWDVQEVSKMYSEAQSHRKTDTPKKAWIKRGY